MTAENRAGRFSFEQMHLLDEAFAAPIVGPNAIVRKVYPTVEPVDLDRIIDIENSPDKIRWFESNSIGYANITREAALREVLDKKHHIVLAVAGLSTREDIHKAGEDGKLQGLLFFNLETNFRLQQLRAKNFAPTDVSSLVLEVSYAKWPPAPGGQISDALRQACKRILDQETSLGHEIVVNAYIINDDRGTNVASVRVLLSSGFEEKGSIKYDDISPDNDRLFVLNREKLAEAIASHK